MRKQLLSLFFSCTTFIVGAQSKIDVLQYSYFIALSDKSDTILCKATIMLKALQPLDTITFDLAGVNSSGKGMKVSKVETAPTDFQAVFIHQRNKLIIIPPHRINQNDVAILSIYYGGIPSDGLIISKNKYGDRTYFADNWPDRAHNWLPCIDRPDEKASFRFTVVAPSHYSVISNGGKTEERKVANEKKMTTWDEDTPLPTKVMVIGVADFAVKTYADSPPGIPVSAWVYKQDSIPGFRNYASAPAILKYFIDYIGPYPYKKLANVQSKTIFGGMENASAIFYEELSGSSDDNIEALIAHEIAHQWFGDMASEKSFPHLWLSEGFATYLTHIYLESKFGTDSLNNRMKNDRQEIVDFARDSKKAVVDSTSPLMGLLNTNSYQKGGWILHMLRRQLGDPVFHRIIRKYYAAYAGKNADTRDFQKICEQESGKDLRVFFDQWLYAPGVPKLDIQWNYDEKSKTVSVRMKQTQNKPFQFPLEIEVRTPSGTTQSKTLNVTEQNQQFTITFKEKPSQLIVDPNISLLYEGTIKAGR